TFTVSGYVVFDEPPYELLPFQIAFRSEDMGPSCAGIPLGALHGLCNGDFGGSPPFDDSSGYVAFSTNPGEESVHLDFHSGNDRLWGRCPTARRMPSPSRVPRCHGASTPTPRAPAHPAPRTARC